MATCNIMTGAGFDTSFLGQYGQAWLVVVLLFFIVVFARKWIGEAMNLNFSTVGGFVGAYLPYLIVITLFCSVKFALLAGIAGMVVGAFFLANLFGDGGYS